MNRIIKLAALGAEVIKRLPAPTISRLNLAITDDCNHKCLFCNIWQKSKGDKISGQEVNKLLEQNKIMWLSITGGEPTLNPEFAEILRLSAAKCKLVNVVSNGEQPNAMYKAVKATTTKDLIVVHISLLGSEKIHDAMVGTDGSYQAVIETVCKLKSLRRPNIIIGFEHMVSSMNEGGWWHVRNLARNMGVGITYTFETKAGYYRNQERNVRQIEMPPFDLGINPIDIFKNGFLRKIGGKRFCVAGQYSCFITADKKVFPCFYAIPDNPAGALNNDFNLSYLKSTTKDWVKNCLINCWTPCESYTALVFKPWRLLV